MPTGIFNPKSIKVVNVAPTDPQAAIVFDAALTAIDHCPALKMRLANRSQSYFSMYTDADMANGKNKASLMFVTGGCSSTGIRGHDVIVACGDEMAFFNTSESSKSSGSEIYSALKPSIAGFQGSGKFICISSPNAKYGKFYDLFCSGMQEKESPTLVFKMYSAMMNPDVLSAEELKYERKRNRSKFLREFGAEFSETISAWIDDEEEFRTCIDPFYVPPKRGMYDTRYYAGLDIGMKNDGTALSIVHEEKGVITLDYTRVWFSGSSDVWDDDKTIYGNCDQFRSLSILDMGKIVDEIVEVNKWFPIKAGILDQHQGYGFTEQLERKGIRSFEVENFNDTKNAEVYEVAKRLWASKMLRIYDDPVLVAELLMLEAEKTGSGRERYDVRAPERKGCHDDISESFVRAVWKCYDAMRNKDGSKKTVVSGLAGGLRFTPEARRSLFHDRQTMKTTGSVFPSRRFG